MNITCNKFFRSGVFVLLGFLSLEGRMSFAEELNAIPVSTPIDTDSAGRGGDVAVYAVIRLICVSENTMGTGFLHKSGNIITANHVVRDCTNLQMVLPNGTTAKASILAMDQDHDLALVKPSVKIAAKPLSIANANDYKIGTQVSTWGFPAGYFGLAPMLSVGFLAGKDAFQPRPGTIIEQWVVNAAFNSGNSGGPLIHIETGEVFGVVSSKLAPISKQATNILAVLENQKSGMQYNGTDTDGKSKSFSEGQLIGMVLNELRQQVQLVIGKAVLLGDLRAFLIANKIDP
jgi:hypothetical protein